MSSRPQAHAAAPSPVKAKPVVDKAGPAVPRSTALMPAAPLPVIKPGSPCDYELSARWTVPVVKYLIASSATVLTPDFFTGPGAVYASGGPADFSASAVMAIRTTEQLLSSLAPGVDFVPTGDIAQANIVWFLSRSPALGTGTDVLGVTYGTGVRVGVAIPGLVGQVTVRTRNDRNLTVIRHEGYHSTGGFPHENDACWPKPLGGLALEFGDINRDLDPDFSFREKPGPFEVKALETAYP
jgi:hypothetical protein